ncbi:MAG TPA: hypothetical protein VGQ33_09780, partial [Vicinamibacteria bacterium]|nr:hypothetical protein [Vicinamibacteria bacterium]
MSATDPREASPANENPDVRFEHRDVDPGTVARWAIGLGVLVVGTAAVSVWLLVFLRHREEKDDPQRPALYFSEEHRQPEGVRLQTSPFGDLHTLRAQEKSILSSYGWVDQAGGVVHIPIDQAMSLYVARQASAAGGAARAAEQGVPTDSAPVPSPLAPAADSAPVPGAHP